MLWCKCHGHITDQQLVILLERDTVKCDSLWRRWCVVHQDEIEREVMQWLKENTFVLRILSLGNLTSAVKRKPA